MQGLRNQMVRLTVMAIVLMAGMFVAAPQAHATTFNFSTDLSSGSSFGAAPYGSVVVLQNGANVDVTVHINSNFVYAKTGAGDSQAFKFNAAGVVLGDISVDAHTPALVATAGAYSGDGGGNFAFGIACPSCGTGTSSTFSNDFTFHVANATILDLSGANAKGFIFAADVGIVVAGTPGATGLVAATGPTVTPEPVSLSLLGLGLVGLGAAMRRNRNR